jgi:cytochrome c peroxidase
MKKIAIILILPILLFAKIQNHTAQEKKGQKYYLQNCSACHGEGNRGGNLADTITWEEYFEDNGKELKELHDENKEALEYLNSKHFKKQKKRMLKFLLEFASDSDFIPSCNN